MVAAPLGRETSISCPLPQSLPGAGGLWCLGLTLSLSGGPETSSRALLGLSGGRMSSVSPRMRGKDKSLPGLPEFLPQSLSGTRFGPISRVRKLGPS